MENLNLKEQMAIEFKYLGIKYADISKRIDTPESTIMGWFETGGKLYQTYLDYAKEMTEKRKQNMEQKLFLSDDEWVAVSTNTVKVYHEQNIKGHKVPLRNKITNEIIYDKDTGEPILIDYRPKVKFSDIKKAWEMQRVMQNKPTAYEKSDVMQTNYEADLVIKELGLTDIDFDDEHREQTAERIRAYLASK